MAGGLVTAVAEAGDPREAPDPTRSRVRLEGDALWMVTAGYADVFASWEDAETGGRRHHLFRATTGAILCELPPQASAAAASTGAPGPALRPVLRIDAVGTDATVLTPLTRAALDERLAALARDNAAARDSAARDSATRDSAARDSGAREGGARDIGPRDNAARGLDQWVAGLCEYVAADRAPQHGTSAAAGQEVTLAEGGVLRPASGVLAVALLAGAAQPFASEPALREGEAILLSARAWLQVEPGGVVRVATAAALIDRGAFWSALDRLHVAAREGIARRLQGIASAERTRFASRMAASVAASSAALDALAAAFRDEPGERLAPPPAAETQHDQLNAACRLIAARLQVPFVVPAASSFRSIKEGVENVARALRIRARHVTLEERWWQHEQGPLLGFTKGTQHAVALLPRARGGGYDLLDPDGAPPRRVDAAVAATLAPGAVTFYRAFGPDPVGFLELIRFSAHGCHADLVMILATGALAGLIATGIPIATGVLINAIIPSTDRGQLLQWTFVLLICTLSTVMFQVARGIALIRLEMKLGYVIQAAVWDRLISLPARFFREYSAGNLATRAMGIDAVRQTLSGATIRGALGGLFSIFNFALMFHYDARLALTGSAVIAIAVLVLVAVSYLQRIQQREAVSLQAKKSGIVLQLLTGIRKLRIAGAEMRAFGIWARVFGDQRRAKARIASLGGVWKTFATLMPLLSLAALIAVMANAGETAPIRTGDFLAFMAAFSGCVNAILSTAGAAIGALSIVPQYELARPILQTPPEISAGQDDPGVLTGEIAVDRVVFGYDPEAPPILNDLSFRARPGEFIAFVGPSGSGKSTILRLLLGFETPQSGAVSYDSRDLKELDVRAVRRQIGVVLQSGRMMPGDIYMNIIGCSSATMEDAWAAARAAGLDEDLKRMPMGMHTMVTDGGGTLSGGQRQRLLIARAIVTNPRMLFFDEATSALDNQTQAIVSQSLDRLRATRIVIAHRLSTIVNADRILVVDKGRIVQSGSYDELMAQPGPFQELARRQLA